MILIDFLNHLLAGTMVVSEIAYEVTEQPGEEDMAKKVHFDLKLLK